MFVRLYIIHHMRLELLNFQMLIRCIPLTTRCSYALFCCSFFFLFVVIFFVHFFFRLFFSFISLFLAFVLAHLFMQFTLEYLIRISFGYDECKVYRFNVFNLPQFDAAFSLCWNNRYHTEDSCMHFLISSFKFDNISKANRDWKIQFDPNCTCSKICQERKKEKNKLQHFESDIEQFRSLFVGRPIFSEFRFCCFFFLLYSTN